ncbi:MAG: 2-succinyl-5-enolpyruvyl-6-hydroxy-3-cyclohexene-1-carboxylic-acid synthase [Bacteroidia bacterium]|jgi:2-succinyl-5-enolpyruvyl-6-hydroxy-3-cyclohexene-1-carboxylate synthase|nr:2-succinyl-5-enolpyruvyl-6-hydroxy-3-cyclohexene-1-carboxylic-acid synthase [Bacteroidia bacterium]
MHEPAFSAALTCKLLDVKHVVLSPGSRSAPLVFAFTNDPDFEVHIAIDERSAAYQAMGMAQQLQKPVVLICTSGTAAANYYPAVCEAFYQRIPLLLLTADRPPELLHQQDGQMINQQQLFGSHVRAFYQMSVNPDKSKHTVTILAEAIAKSCFPVKGPVHINFPFVEPLYQLNNLNKTVQLKQQIGKWLNKHLIRSATSPTNEELDELTFAWVNSKKRIILIGTQHMDYTCWQALKTIHENNQAVIIADVTSNFHQFASICHIDQIIQALSIKEENKPDFILSLGGPLLSKPLKKWLTGCNPQWHFRINQEPETINTYGNLTHLLSLQPATVFNEIAAIQLFDNTQEQQYVQKFITLDKQIEQYKNKLISKSNWNEISAIDYIKKELPQVCAIQLGNSSAIRLFANTGNNSNGWQLFANRGTSGIDGSLSTALGAAIINQRLTFCILGDLSFGYDINALWRLNLPPQLRIIVINNHGGGIFKLIDGPNTHPEYLSYFTTPVKVNVQELANAFGLEHYLCRNMNELEKKFKKFSSPLGKASILELEFNDETFHTFYKKFTSINFITNE